MGHPVPGQPATGITNRRHQMSDARYQPAGGAPYLAGDRARTGDLCEPRSVRSTSWTAGCGFQCARGRVIDEIGERNRAILMVVLDQPTPNGDASDSTFDPATLDANEVVLRISAFDDVPRPTGGGRSRRTVPGRPCPRDVHQRRTNREVIDTYHGKVVRGATDLDHQFPGGGSMPARAWS